MMYIKFCGVEIIEVSFIAFSRTLGLFAGHISYHLIIVRLFLKWCIDMNDIYLANYSCIIMKFSLAGWFSVNSTEENKEEPFGK